MSSYHLFVNYLIIINIITFFIYGFDKWKAKRRKRRISEISLLALAVIGGGIGAWIGMKVWHHKTLHKKFRYGVPVILMIQVALFILYSCYSAKLHYLHHTLSSTLSI